MVKKAFQGKEIAKEFTEIEDLRAGFESMQKILSSSCHLVEDLNPMWFQYKKAQREFLTKTFSKERQQPHQLFILFFQEENNHGVGEMYRVNEQGEYEGERIETDLDSFLSYCRERGEGGEVLYYENCENPCLDSLPKEIKDRISSIQNFVLYSNENSLLLTLNYPHPVSSLQGEILKGIALQLFLYRTISLQTEKIREAFIYTASALARAAEAKDVETGHHIQRVSRYSLLLAKRLSFDRQELEEIAYSSKMHDVGKINISHTILLKPGPLSPEEFMEMENHTVYGVLILGDSPYLEMARTIALSHHERWDGTGYPYQIKKEEIPPAACIVSIADIYDALRSSRPYKPPFDHDRACRIILEGDGRVEPHHFHPQVLETFRDLSETFARIFEELS